MAAQQSSIISWYSDLNKFIHVSDYKQALKAANKILHSKDGKDDIEAMHCKVVCMIEMSQFAETLKFINLTEPIKDLLLFEKAYCQYRLLDAQDALDTINDAKNPDSRLLELKAQVLYKLGCYQESLVVYKRLIKDCSDDFEEERMTNFSAVHAALSTFEGVETDLRFNAETHEQLYNRGCWLLGQNKLKEAEETLVRAEKVCQELFADDPEMTEEEREAEVAVIRVQRGYALQLQGKDDEALAIYNQAIRLRPTDLALVAVASNNIISINKDQNVFDSRKKMKATTASGVELKLVPFQKQKIDFNRALLFMYSNQWEPCRKLLKILQREYRTSDIPCLIQAAQLCREKNASKATDFMKDFIDSHSDPDLHKDLDLTNVKLAYVQLLLGQGEIDKSCQLIESMKEICFTPAMVSCLVALYNTQSNPVQSVTNLMEKAIEWHKKKKSSPAVLKTLLWDYSQFLLKHNNPHDAAMTLEDMLRLDPKNVKVLAQLIFAYSQFNTSKAHQISDDLPSLQELSVHVDVDELERNANQLAPRYIKKQKERKEVVQEKVDVNKTGLVSEGSATPSVIKKTKKKKKKNPVPKNFQPNFVPDPERWIALRERSTYKGRRKNRKKGGVGKGTQGSNVGSSENYDMSQKSTSSTSAPGPNPPKPGSASGSQGNTPVNSPKPTKNKGGGKKKQADKRKKKGGRGW